MTMLFFNFIVLTALLVAMEGVHGIAIDPATCPPNLRIALLQAMTEVPLIAQVALDYTRALKTLGQSPCQHATVFNTFQAYFRNGYLNGRGDVVEGKSFFFSLFFLVAIITIH